MKGREEIGVAVCGGKGANFKGSPEKSCEGQVCLCGRGSVYVSPQKIGRKGEGERGELGRRGNSRGEDVVCVVCGVVCAGTSPVVGNEEAQTERDNIGVCVCEEEDMVGVCVGRERRGKMSLQNP